VLEIFTVTLSDFTYAIWAIAMFYQYSCKAPWWWSQKWPKHVGEYKYMMKAYFISVHLFSA